MIYKNTTNEKYIIRSSDSPYFRLIECLKCGYIERRLWNVEFRKCEKRG